MMLFHLTKVLHQCQYDELILIYSRCLYFFNCQEQPVSEKNRVRLVSEISMRDEQLDNEGWGEKKEVILLTSCHEMKDGNVSSRVFFLL